MNKAPPGNLNTGDFLLASSTLNNIADHVCNWASSLRYEVRLQQHRSCKGVVHNMREIVLLGEGCHSLQIRHANQRIADGLHIEHL